MDTSELVKFLTEEKFTAAEAYALLVADMEKFVTNDEITQGQRVASFLIYKIQQILLPAIISLKERRGDS